MNYNFTSRIKSFHRKWKKSLIKHLNCKKHKTSNAIINKRIDRSNNDAINNQNDYDYNVNYYNIIDATKTKNWIEC